MGRSPLAPPAPGSGTRSCVESAFTPAETARADKPRPPRRPAGAVCHPLRPSRRPVHALLRRDVGAVLVLRHAGPAGLLHDQGLPEVPATATPTRSTGPTRRWSTWRRSSAACWPTGCWAPRRAVILGGLLMAAGHLLMTVQNSLGFFTALALLICGNGFFKPNISTIVGSLYPPGSPKRDGGFTIFYMGINLGAAMSPAAVRLRRRDLRLALGFGLATIGMLVGVAVFVAPTLPDAVADRGHRGGDRRRAVDLPSRHTFSIGVNVFVGLSLLLAGGWHAWPWAAGRCRPGPGPRPTAERLHARCWAPFRAEWLVYLGTAVAVVGFVLLVSGFGRSSTADNRPMSLISDKAIDGLAAQPQRLGPRCWPWWPRRASRPASAGAVPGRPGGLRLRGPRDLPPRPHRPAPDVRGAVLTFFSMLFWSFFEQAGSSLNNFTDRNVDRVVGPPHRHRGRGGPDHPHPAHPETTRLPQRPGDVHARRAGPAPQPAPGRARRTPISEIDWKVTPDDVGMGIANRDDEIPASTFQSVNPLYILIFGLVFTALWTFLGRRGWEPEHDGQVRPGPVATGPGLRGLLVRHHRPTPRHGRLGVALAGLPAAHHRRAVPLAGGAVDGHPALAAPGWSAR